MTVRMHPRPRLSNGGRDPNERDESPTTPQMIEAAAQKYVAKRLDETMPPNPLDGLPARPRRHRGLNSWEPAQFTERPSWHAVMTPEPVAAAWEAVLAAVEAVEESSRAVKALSADEAAEQDRYDAAVVAAIKAGAEVPAPDKVTEWSQERVKCEAIDRVRQQEVRDARRAYEEAVREAMPEWQAAVEAELPKLTAAAEQVIAAARPAVSDLAAAHGVLAAMADDATPAVHGRRSADAVQQARAVAEHHRDLSSAARVGLQRLDEATQG